MDDQPVTKAGALVRRGSRVRVKASPRYASRGGEKLQGALEHYGLEPGGRVALDVGASTGGFTDCLLAHGAARVHAVDVGYGQLDWRLRQDPRVVVAGTDEHPPSRSRRVSREPRSGRRGRILHIVGLVLPRVCGLLSRPFEIMALIKPQFEVARERSARVEWSGRSRNTGESSVRSRRRWTRWIDAPPGFSVAAARTQGEQGVLHLLSLAGGFTPDSNAVGGLDLDG